MNDMSINQAEKFATPQPQVKNASALLGEDDFLKLLAVQLQYQDPLEPMENTEFIAQMAQFSTLEGITNMSKSMKSMSEQIVSMNNLSTTSLIGKEVKVFGNEFTLSGDENKELIYLMMGGATNVKVNIVDSNGVQVRSLMVGSQLAGGGSVVWDGLNEEGLRVPSGEYTFNIKASDGGGDVVEARTMIKDKVEGIVYENGIPYLLIDDSMVGIHEILEVLG